MRLVYRLNEAIPEIGALKDDVLLVEPGHDPPVIRIREVDPHGTLSVIEAARARLQHHPCLAREPPHLPFPQA